MKLDWNLQTDAQRVSYIKSQSNLMDAREAGFLGDYLLAPYAKETKAILPPFKKEQKTAPKDLSISVHQGLLDNGQSIVSHSAPQPRLNRKETRTLLSDRPDILASLEDLWTQIDITELTINYYEIQHNLRKNPPRPKLIARIPQSSQEMALSQSSRWNQQQYYYFRRHLIELRRTQYLLRGFATQSVGTGRCATSRGGTDEGGGVGGVGGVGDESWGNEGNWESEGYYDNIASLSRNIEELPFDEDIMKRCPEIFDVVKVEELTGKLFVEGDTEEVVKKISDYYWRFCAQNLRAREEGKLELCFDFRDEAQVLKFVRLAKELPLGLLKLLNYYINLCAFPPAYQEIIILEMEGASNKKIKEVINTTYSKTYSENYISTIFLKKIIPKIADCARQHQTIIESLPFSEEFKTCVRCKRKYLLTNDNFMKKSRNPDGFENRCKPCLSRRAAAPQPQSAERDIAAAPQVPRIRLGAQNDDDKE